MIKKILLMLAALVCFPAHAIVSMEGLHLNEAIDGLTGSASLGANGALGNSERVRINGTGHMLYQHDASRYFVTLQYAYGESNGREDQNKTYSHVRRIHALTPKTDWELFVQLENDKFSRLNLRAVAGLGLRFSMYKTPHSVIYLGLGGFYNYEDIKDKENLSDSGIQQEIKGNAYLVLQKKLLKNVTLISTTYLHPVLREPNDFRLLEEGKIKFHLSNKLSLNLNVQIKYDNRPPQLVEKTDINYSTKLEYVF